jgi:mannose-6-phosphate isomerase-like protein (cupin superfamily)
MLLQIYPNDDIIFVNGGDRNKENIPEMIFPEVSFVFGVGGTNKIESSSSLLREWKEPKVNRSWGHYRTLYNTDGTKVKELTINPNSKLSVQKHFKRNEYWHVVEGEIIAQSFMENGYTLPPVNLHPHDSYVVKVGEWHTLDNPTDKYVKMIEIQYGQECIEDDIVRK